MAYIPTMPHTYINHNIYNTYTYGSNVILLILLDLHLIEPNAYKSQFILPIILGS